MMCTTDPADMLAGLIVPALDTFVMQMVMQTYEAVQLAGDRDYLDADDVDGLYRAIARAITANGFRLPLPRPEQIAETARRLNIKVML